MTEEEKSEYKKLPLDEKSRFLLMFWRKKDPDPLTENNERLIEHLKRVKFVKTVYTPDKYPSQDDRGKIYVKYGAPDSRYISTGGSKGFSRGNESWVYNTIHRDLSFDFVDFGGIYKQVKDLKEAIVVIPNKYRNIKFSVDLKLISSIELYKERANLSINYEKLATDDVEEFLDNYYNFTVNREIAEIEAPPERYIPKYSFKPGLDITATYAQFRNKNKKTKVEIYLGIYLKKEDFIKKELKYVTQYNALYAIFDRNLEREKEFKRSYSAFVNDISFSENTISKYQENLIITPGKRELALKLINEKSNRGGIFKIDIPVKDFSSDKLMISDIQFSENIFPSNEKSPDVKNGLKVVPYPFNTIKKEKPLFIYFEIYNLKPDLSGKTFYKIEYILKQKNQSVNLTSNIIGGTELENYPRIKKTENTEVKYIQFDFSSINRGKSQLIIKLTDMNSGQSAETVRNFEIR